MDLNLKIEKSNDYLEVNSEVEIKVSKYDHNKKAELVRRINKMLLILIFFMFYV